MFMTCVIFINFHESIEKNYTNHCHSSFGGVASWILAQTHSRTFADKMSWISGMRSVKPCFKDRQKPEKKTCFQFPSLIKSTFFCCNSGLSHLTLTSHHFVVCPKVLSRLAACAAAEMARSSPTLPAWLEECSGNASGRFAMEKVAPMGR